MKSELHRRAFWSIRHLMAEAGYVDHDMFYDDLESLTYMMETIFPLPIPVILQALS